MRPAHQEENGTTPSNRKQVPIQLPCYKAEDRCRRPQDAMPPAVPAEKLFCRHSTTLKVASAALDEGAQASGRIKRDVKRHLLEKPKERSAALCGKLTGGSIFNEREQKRKRYGTRY